MRSRAISRAPEKWERAQRDPRTDPQTKMLLRHLNEYHAGVATLLQENDSCIWSEMVKSCIRL